MKNKIASFNSENLKEIKKEIEIALKIIGNKYDVSFKVGNIRYDNNEFSTKLNCVLNKSVDVKEGEDVIAKALWKKNCWKYSMHENDFGRTFDAANNSGKTESYKIIGCKPKSKKNPILAKDNKGQTWKISLSKITNLRD